MSENITPIKTLVETYAAEATKFYGGNNAAGTRARKALQELTKLAKIERKSITEAKNARKAAK
jgi:hypothetical protein